MQSVKLVGFNYIHHKCLEQEYVHTYIHTYFEPKSKPASPIIDINLLERKVLKKKGGGQA